MSSSGITGGDPALFRAIVESTGDGVVVLDRERRIRLANAAAAARLGGAPEDLLGEAFVYPFSLGATEEVTLHRGDADAAPVELAAREVVWEGEPATLIVLRDLSQRRDAMRLGRRMERQLRGAHRREAIGSLAAGLAHDFNNFLTVILGRSELLLRRLEGDDELSRQVRLIHMGAKHHSVLTRQFLGMASRESGPPHNLDTEGTLRATAPVLAAALGDAIDVEVEVTPDTEAVRMPQGAIEQILVNLALNARDAMPQGGRLTIRAESIEVADGIEACPVELAPGHYVRFDVSDTGAGMSAHVLRHAFEPFFTTRSPREGGGLGLSVVHGIVEENQGGIWLASTMGEGTTVSFLLPSAGRLAQQPAPQPMLRPADARGAILLVEDEPDVRALVREILETRSFEVLEAEDGLEATHVMATHAGSLEMVLTDVVMPRMSGADLARSIGKSNPDVPVLYMSGYTRRDIYRRGLIPDGAPYIQKPFPPGELLAAVDRVTA